MEKKLDTLVGKSRNQFIDSDNQTDETNCIEHKRISLKVILYRNILNGFRHIICHVADNKTTNTEDKGQRKK